LCFPQIHAILAKADFHEKEGTIFMKKGITLLLVLALLTPFTARADIHGVPPWATSW
jgi:hypothetical protein